MKVIIKNAGNKGKGIFAIRDIKKGEIILKRDYSKLKKYTLKEISENQVLKKKTEHCDYVGNEKYVIDFSPFSYVNHSCKPNAYTEFKSLKKGVLIALRDIQKGEEITMDCTLSAVDQIKDKRNKEFYYWKLKCYCGSKNCRKIVHGDFFKMPLSYQKENLVYLPSYIKRKYKERLQKLK